jgi:hypothetical protein
MPGNFRINPTPPAGFFEEYEVTLQIRYERIGNDYSFHYKTKKIKATGHNLVERIPAKGWNTFIIGNVVVADLDFGIDYADTTVIIETVDDAGNNDMFWNKDALMTKDDRTDLYGELRYGDGPDWLDQPPARCRRIQFRAKLNTNKKDNVHAFSFNILIPDGANGSMPLEIDPDIKNPSV